MEVPRAGNFLASSPPLMRTRGGRTAGSGAGQRLDHVLRRDRNSRREVMLLLTVSGGDWKAAPRTGDHSGRFSSVDPMISKRERRNS
jgi:hypothetical protein